MGREAFDDWRRHRHDKVENNRSTYVAVRAGSGEHSGLNGQNLGGSTEAAAASNSAAPGAAASVTALTTYDNDSGDAGASSAEHRDSSDSVEAEAEGLFKYQKIPWNQVRVGDIVRLKQDDWVPADIVVLQASGDDSIAYIETMALDGETNLKQRGPMPELVSLLDTPSKMANFEGEIVTEDPNLDLYNFEAAIHIDGKTLPLSSEHVVYRGSVIRNTRSVLGFVVFTGEESKIRMNSIANARTKAPRLQGQVNKIVIFMVCFVLLLAVFCTVASRIYYSSEGSSMWFLVGLEVGVVPNLMGFIIMLNTLIPLSLYVSMEIIKVVQMLMLQLDVDMYHPESDTPCEARTATINEELGQVSYIFSDKTGTLTDNVMLFRKLSVAGHAWVHDLDVVNSKVYQQIEADDATPATPGTPGIGSGHVEFRLPPLDRGGRPSIDDIYRQVSALPRKSGLSRPSMASMTSGNATGRRSTASIRLSGPGRASGGRASGPSGGGGRVSGSRPSGATGLTRPSMASIGTTGTAWRSTANPDRVQDDLSTLQLLQYMQLNPNSVYTKRVKFFLLSIALCHTCLPETRASKQRGANKAKAKAKNDTDMDGSGDDAESHAITPGDPLEDLEYHSASPDEEALVSAARDLGYIVIDRAHKSITIRTYPNGFGLIPTDEVYEILDVIDFSSSRKRMSVVAKFPDGRIGVFCKGADNIILERLRLAQLALGKSSEIAASSAARKTAESQFIITKNSMSSMASPPRISTSGLHGRRSINVDRKAALASIESHFERAHHYDDVEQIAESSRRSMTLARQKRYEADTTGPSGRHSDGGPSGRSGGRRSVDALRNVESLNDVRGGRPDGRDGRPSLDVSRLAEVSVDIDDRLVVNDDFVIEQTLEHIEQFSTEGLRTLLYAYRWMDQEEYDHWIKLYKDARVSLVDRQEKIEKVGEMIESGFELCGATAIEDKLQEGVPEAIDKLRRANIRLWMLTGDKRETAINIGYSCRLIKDFSTVVILRSDEGDVAGKMAAAMLALEGGNVAHCVVVVDGGTLGYIEKDMTLMSLFIDLGVKADSVICCRASPAQKASMVRAVRQKVSSAVTLAIGDGANDIAMIQSADVGVGITGKEGLQAARSSDFSIAQFRFLLKLLLVHGRWNYVRISKYILGTFYKELFFYLTQVIYQRYTMFTGTSLYENWSLSMFNTLFTSLPVLCVGIFDRDMAPATLLAVPELYTKGQKNQGFNLMLYIGWMLVAVSQSVLVSFMVAYLYGFTAVIDNTIYPLSTLSFTTILITICLKLLFVEMYTISVANVVAFVVSVGGWFVWDMLLSLVYKNKASMIYLVYDALFYRFGRDLSWWCTLLASFCAPSIFDLAIQATRLQIWASDSETFQQIEHDPAVRRRFEKESAVELQMSNEGREEDVAEYHDSPEPRTRDKIKRRLGSMGLRKTSGEYEREVERILERREMEMDNLG